MPIRTSTPTGAPCWADLWTSDVEGSRRFYGEFFGWEAMEPSAEFGGYFMFNRAGQPVAGAMGGMPDNPAQDVWKIYLATDDVQRTAAAAEAYGAQIAVPPMPVADLGVQAVLTDPVGATVGAWQPGTFAGFSVLDEPGAPSWFELFSTDFARSVDFYRSVFGWETEVVSDTADFRYSVLHPGDDVQLAGIMDATALIPKGASYWAIYWEVEEVDEAVAKLRSLGGGVASEPSDTPYGRMATVTDPRGAAFKLRQAPTA
ncbi:MAG: VOC family protein [Acidimicrobiales bacterium]